MVADQAAEGYPVTLPVETPQTIDPLRFDPHHLGHVAVDPHVDEGEQARLGRIERVVQVENGYRHGLPREECEVGKEGRNAPLSRRRKLVIGGRTHLRKPGWRGRS